MPPSPHQPAAAAALQPSLPGQAHTHIQSAKAKVCKNFAMRRSAAPLTKAMLLLLLLLSLSSRPEPPPLRARSLASLARAKGGGGREDCKRYKDTHTHTRRHCVCAMQQRRRRRWRRQNTTKEEGGLPLHFGIALSERPKVYFSQEGCKLKLEEEVPPTKKKKKSLFVAAGLGVFCSLCC